MEAVESATALVVILTRNAGASRNVLSEVEQAFQAGKGILPFRLDASPLPASLDYFLAPTQWLDAPEGCTPENLKRLADATAQVLAGSPIPSADRLPPWWRTWKIAAAGSRRSACREESLPRSTPATIAWDSAARVMNRNLEKWPRAKRARPPAPMGVKIRAPSRFRASEVGSRIAYSVR